MARIVTMLFLSILLAAPTLDPSPSQAALLDKLINIKTFPQCDDAVVLKRIIRRFNWAERHTWHRGFTLDDVIDARHRRTEGLDTDLIPRRYCRGHAILSNGTHPTVHYLIEGGQGFAGNGFRVEFCVNGLDPWRVYNGHCRVLRY